MSFFELRQYTATPGNRKALVKMMEEEVIPFQTEAGMVILGSFVSEEDEDTYVWVRRFRTEAEREKLYKKVYESARWKDDIGPRIMPLIDRSGINVKRILATPRSPIQ
ncbi:MAG: NIPSNAP family protein [Dehalococcoidia bacterium]